MYMRRIESEKNSTTISEVNSVRSIDNINLSSVSVIGGAYQV